MSESKLVVPVWRKIPLRSSEQYRAWWLENCQECCKSMNHKDENDCDLETAMCKASVAQHGIYGKKVSDTSMDIIGGGYTTQEICDRLGIVGSELPWDCPEKQLIEDDNGGKES